ncbi:MAG: DUF3015 family protein [Salinisphaera sp.]|nr:DUF3015 family protein [Salinisphaera sp.]
MKNCLNLLPLSACTLLALSGCAAFTSTTNTAADAAHTITHGVSVSSRSSTNASAGDSSRSASAETRAYMRSQMPEIRREAAAGGGEHIDALARLMNDGTPAASSSDLGRWMQAHYDPLFTTNRSVGSMIGDIRARRS